jgi:Spy/CpxP family protein refolding chaperone
VQAGQIDRAALQPKIDALVATLQKLQPADRAAFEQLHALLTPDQRVAFVDALKARVGERLHAAVEKHPMKQWAEDLKLTDDQKAQIKAAMQQHFQAMAKQHGPEERPWEHAREQGEKVLSAFEQDRFVMDEVAPQKDVAQKVAKFSEHLLGMAEAAVPVLTPEQRAIAAQKICEHADAMDEQASPLP